MPLHPAVGVEAVDADLSKPAGPAEVSALREAFAAHHLVLVRGQHDVGAAEQVRFAGLFGPVLCDRPGVDHSYVSNAHPEGIIRDGALLFHSDLAFTAEPVLGISLAAVDVAAAEAVTCYANAQRALGLLSAELREQLRGVRGHHLFDLTNQVGNRRLSDAELDPVEPRHAHPVVYPNPHNGGEVLYVSDLQTSHLLDMPAEQSDDLLGELFAVLYRPDNVYEHRWQPGDVVVWDNIALQHARPDPGATPRTLRRVTLAHHSVPELVAGYSLPPRGA